MANSANNATTARAEKMHAMLTEDGDSRYGGRVWVEAPDGATALRVTEVTEYEATGEVVNDAKIGLVRVFREVKRRWSVELASPGDEHPPHSDAVVIEGPAIVPEHSEIAHSAAIVKPT